MKAVIMCGGVGSRLRPITESIPKPMVKLLNKPVIDLIIEKLVSAGIKDIYISLGFMATEIIEHCEFKKFDANITYCTEDKPLGTAGGVKNCIKNTDDDILILSGDNVFDFALADFYGYHFSSDADITVCAVRSDDPREYGVIVKDDDGSIISFVEKPTWEQAKTNYVNTGIYLLRGSVLDLIPENKFFDFSEDLFPDVFRRDMRFMCYTTEGYWGDMGEFSSYRQITRDAFCGIYNDEILKRQIRQNESVFCNGAAVSEKSLIGENTVIGENTLIGPFCVIGDNCKIENNSTLNGVIIGDNCIIGSNCELKNCIIADNVIIRDNCSIEENAVLGYGCEVGRFSRVLQSIRIWPGRKISAESVVTRDMFYETSESFQFDIFGISGKINSQITVSDAAKLGQAVASLKEIKKIGFGTDFGMSSGIYKDICLSGARTCGALCYDFGEMFRSQAYFYSAYCTLDAFIFVSTNGDVIKFSFYGKYGLPLSSRQARNINNNFRYSSFSYCGVDGYSDIYNMTLFSTVYKSYFKKACGDRAHEISVFTESDNPLISQMLSDIFTTESKNVKDKSIQLLINNNGTDFYIIEEGKMYSSDRILSLLCELEFAENHNVIIPEDAPIIIDETAEKYDCEVLRVFESSLSNIEFDSETVLNSVWCFDSVMMCAEIIRLLTTAEVTLRQLFEYQKEFAVRRTVIEFDTEPGKIRGIIENSGAEKKDGDMYYVINNRKGKARIRQMGNAKRIRLLVEAADMETAKEIAVLVSKKIKNSDIDNNK